MVDRGRFYKKNRAAKETQLTSRLSVINGPPLATNTNNSENQPMVSWVKRKKRLVDLKRVKPHAGTRI